MTVKLGGKIDTEIEDVVSIRQEDRLIYIKLSNGEEKVLNCNMKTYVFSIAV